MLSCLRRRTVKRRTKDWSFIRGGCLRPKYSHMKAMQCTTIETANDDGLLREGGSSVKRVVIREDLMKDRTPFVKIAEVFAYTHRQALGEFTIFCGSGTVKTSS